VNGAARFGIAPVVIVSLLLTLGSGGRATASHSYKGSWPYPNGDIANNRDAPDSAISSSNVSELKQAWTFKLRERAAAGVNGYGSLAGTPIVQNGVVYFQDLHCNVYALYLATGKQKWEYRFRSTHTLGPNGVAVADGRVYGDSPTTVFALNASTGRRVWVQNLKNTGRGVLDIQPQVANGRVYLATTAGSLPGGGVLFALDASNGALLWKFNTVPQSDPGVVAAGGAWETPLVNNDGSVTFGIGNPYQSISSALTHPSALPYTDSEVNLQSDAGHLRWSYQGLPDDFSDYDMQVSPVSVTINGERVIIGAGKMGYVYELDARTGQLIWKTSVGAHNGHDNDSSQALTHSFSPTFPYTILPGGYGGVLTNVAVAGANLYVTVCDEAYSITNSNQIVGINAPGGSPILGTGQMEDLNLATGKVEWNTELPYLPLGAATVSNDLVFTTLYPGVLLALDRNTGAILYRRRLPTSSNSSIAIAGNFVLVPDGGPTTGTAGHNPQLIAFETS